MGAMKQSTGFKGLAVVAAFLLWSCGGDPIPPEPPPVPVEEEPVEETVPEEPEPEPEPAPVAEPEAVPEPETAAETTAEPDIVVPVQGSIVSRKGKKVVIAVDHPDPPAAGEKGKLLKFFEKNVGPTTMSGWLVIADVIVKKSASGKIHLQIVEEISKMTVNKKKVNHFKKGNTVKLEMH